MRSKLEATDGCHLNYFFDTFHLNGSYSLRSYTDMPAHHTQRLAYLETSARLI